MKSVIAFALALLMVAGGNSAEASDSTDVHQHLADGDRMYIQYQYAPALAAYEEARKADSTSFGILTRLARTYTDYGLDFQHEDRKMEAERHFRKGVEAAQALQALYPDSVMTYFHLSATIGQLALFMGGRDKVRIGRQVEDYCRQGLALDSTNARLLVAYGVFQREVSELNWFERTVARTLFGRLPEGTKEGALLLLHRAVTYDPELAIAQFQLGMTYRSEGRHAEAARHLQIAAALPAENTGDIRNRMTAMAVLGQLAGED